MDLRAGVVKELAQTLKAEREALAAQVRAGAGGLATAASYSDLVDSVIRRMLSIAMERAGSSRTPETLPMAVVATGGYGRREVCPYSDVDLTFIPHRDGDPDLDAIIKELFSLVMHVFIDGNKVEVGYAYRLMDDCAALDHQTTSGLLDARLVAGSQRLFIQFEDAFWSSFNATSFIFEKLEERRAQHVSEGGTPWTVEPNLKSGVGGLRDLHAAVWVSQASQALEAARARGDRAWEVLSRQGGMLRGEVEDIRAAKEFLFCTRNALHVLAGRELDQLNVDRQEDVAAMLGYVEEPGEGSMPPFQRFMRDLYRHMSAVHRIGLDVASHVERGRLVLGVGLDCVGRAVTPAQVLLGAVEPDWMVMAFELAQRYELGFTADLDRAIVAAVAADPVCAAPAVAGEAFTRMLASGRPCFRVLQHMAEIGLLGWLLPEFGEVMGLVPFDSAHDFTVGQHSLYVVRFVDELLDKGGPDALRELRQICAELPHRECLYMAALLHDVGKIGTDRPHADSGADAARRVCARLGWSEEAGETVAFLVQHHLRMAELSGLHDLTLDSTIQRFVDVVSDVDRLQMLYLLTYADTRAVGAGVWTDVKARFLRDLYRRADQALAGDLTDDMDPAGLIRARKHLVRELAVDNLPAPEVEAHVAGLPGSYMLNTSFEEIALHIGLARGARRGAPGVAFHDPRGAGYTEVTVCALDEPRPGLLAKIAGALYAADLAVHSAQVFTRVSGDERIAFDTLFVDFRGRQLTPGKRKEVSDHVTAVLTGAVAVADLVSRKRRKARPFVADETAVHHMRGEGFSLVQVASQDLQATLYRVAEALAALGWDILSARVSVFKNKARGNFYVKGALGLDPAQAAAMLRKALHAGAHGPAAPAEER